MAIEIPPVGTYHVSADESEIQFAVKHRFGTGTVRGRFAVTGGSIVVADPADRSTVSVTADPASFSSGNSSRDAKIRSTTFLDTTSHPSITLTSRSIEHLSDGSWKLCGTLDAHGVAVATTFTLTEARSSADSVELTAVGTVDRYAHGVRAMKGMAGRRLDLSVSIRAVRA